MWYEPACEAFTSRCLDRYYLQGKVNLSAKCNSALVDNCPLILSVSSEGSFNESVLWRTSAD